MKRSTIITTAAAATLLLAACGAGDTADGSTIPIPETTTTAEVPTTVPETTTTVPETTTTQPTTTTTEGSTPTTEPAGEEIDFGPRAGDVLAVVGVAHDDVLNVRSGPGVGNPVVAELDPTADDVVAEGTTWQLPEGFWIEVDADGVTGWVNLTYMAYLGETNDITARVIELLGETPEVETMLDMGTLVAEAIAEESGGEGVDIVMSVAPSVGDLGEVTFDVVGFADDSVRGARLHVFGTPSESGEGFVLKSVESTTFCGRGVTDGACL
jgi:hypothetical protein